MTLAARFLIGGLLAVIVATGSVCAAEPGTGTPGQDGVPATEAAGAVGVGSAIEGMTPGQLGYTSAIADAKAAAAEGYAAAALLASAGLTPGGPYPRSGSLAGYVQYHQKTTHWCLAAVIQSILRFKFGGGWISTSVYAKQREIDAAISSAGVEYSNLGIQYINARLAAYQSGFRYVSMGRAATWNQMSGWVQMDVSLQAFPTYVSVEVSNPNYVWVQASKANHATAAVGYSEYGTLARIGDPFTSPSTGPAYCQVGKFSPAYSTAPDLGCIYPAYDMRKYYLASTSAWI